MECYLRGDESIPLGIPKKIKFTRIDDSFFPCTIQEFRERFYGIDVNPREK